MRDNPYFVFFASLFLPGSGHVLQGRAQRGLTFLFFMIILGWVSTKVIPPEASFFARHVGGIFIYGLCALDAYKWAKVRELNGK
jgi:hypothetical protein